MRKLLAAASFIAMAPYAAQAKHVVVAVGTCEPQDANFATIQDAVTAVPAGSTVLVCPGTYAEQVTISKSLIVQGVAAGSSSQAAVVLPANFVANATDLDGGGPIVTQFLVTGGATVTIANLTIDASGNNIQSCATDIVGILYQNASGTVRGNWVKNQSPAPGYTGCQTGLAIYVETGGLGTASVTITGNQVQNFAKNGITGDDMGANLTVTGNKVLGSGPTTGAAENAVQIAFGATGTITGNTVGDAIWAPDQFGDTGDAAAGLLVYDSPGVMIKSNIVASTQYGIAVVSDGNGSADSATVMGNTVLSTHLYDGVDICGSNNSSVTGNTIDSSDESAVHIDSTCKSPSTGATVTGNSFAGSCAGVLVGTGSGGNIASNTGVNLTNTMVTGSDVCPVQNNGASRALRLRPRPFHGTRRG